MAGRGGRQANSRAELYSGLPSRDYVMIDAPLPAHVAKWACRRTPWVMEPWKCPGCSGSWTDRGSYAANKCTRCSTARPTETLN